jgi:hypothetical protein
MMIGRYLQRDVSDRKLDWEHSPSGMHMVNDYVDFLVYHLVVVPELVCTPDHNTHSLLVSSHLLRRLARNPKHPLVDFVEVDVSTIRSALAFSSYMNL